MTIFGKAIVLGKHWYPLGLPLSISHFSCTLNTLDLHSLRKDPCISLFSLCFFFLFLFLALIKSMGNKRCKFLIWQKVGFEQSCAMLAWKPLLRHDHLTVLLVETDYPRELLGGSHSQSPLSIMKKKPEYLGTKGFFEYRIQVHCSMWNWQWMQQDIAENGCSHFPSSPDGGI